MENKIDVCGTCEFIFEYPLDKNNITSRSYGCRFNPPTINEFAIQTQTGQMAITSRSTYPQVSKKMICCSSYFYRNYKLVTDDDIKKSIKNENSNGDSQTTQLLQ